MQHPDAGLLIGNGFGFTDATCANRATCNGRPRGIPVRQRRQQLEQRQRRQLRSDGQWRRRRPRRPDQASLKGGNGRICRADLGQRGSSGNGSTGANSGDGGKGGLFGGIGGSGGVGGPGCHDMHRSEVPGHGPRRQGQQRRPGWPVLRNQRPQRRNATAAGFAAVRGVRPQVPVTTPGGQQEINPNGTGAIYPDDSDPSKPYAMPGTVVASVQLRRDSWSAGSGYPHRRVLHPIPVTSPNSRCPGQPGRAFLPVRGEGSTALPPGYRIEQSQLAPWFRTARRRHPVPHHLHRPDDGQESDGRVQALLDSGYLGYR